MAETEAPVRLAIFDRESPLLTTYRVVLGLTTTGFGLALGLGFALTTVVVGLVVVVLLGSAVVLIGVEEMTGVGFELFPVTSGTEFCGG